MEQDRENQIKANSVHVDDNFNTLLGAVNNKLDLDGTSTPTADIPFGGHKATNLGTPTVSADAATKGYVDTALTFKANTASPVFTGSPEAPTQAATDNGTKIATTAFVYNVLQAMYPVGAIYIGVGNTCPMSTLFGTWTLVASGKALWTGDGTNADTTIAAGLPNITGYIGVWSDEIISPQPSGAFALNRSKSARMYDGADKRTSTNGFDFDASRSSSVYGNSTTVQPPAYVVNVWKRTA
jgi:hypothetical protein